jgi:hypothetical protein
VKCTAPSTPRCENDASAELLSLTGAHLGYNCPVHISRLRFVKTGNLDAEYRQAPLKAESGDEALAV